MSGRRVIAGRIWEVFDAAVAVRTRENRAPLREEVAAELGWRPEDTPIFGLVRAGLGYATGVTVEGVTRSTVMPVETEAPLLLPALVAFRSIPVGSVVEWNEQRRIIPRINPRGATRRLVAVPQSTGKLKRMKVDNTLRSRVRSYLLRIRDRLGLRRLSDARHEHIPMLLDLVWTLTMEASLVPREQWHASTPAAKSARKTASNRKSEMKLFLEWAASEGYVPLNAWDAATLPRPWAEFALKAPEFKHQVDVRAIANRAVALGCDSPERLVELGFEIYERDHYADPRYANAQSARRMMVKLRQAWHRAAEQTEHIPGWPAHNPNPKIRRLEDGGLGLTWWSAQGFFEGKEPLLDGPDMALQKREARDLHDWWTLRRPEDRPASGGGPLPPRPQTGGRYGKKLGARSEKERTAIQPMRAVSRFQRWAMSEDTEAPISLEEMKALPWRDLVGDQDRVLRFVRSEMRRLYEQNGGKLHKGSGVDYCKYIGIIARFYFPSYLEVEFQAMRKEKLRLVTGPATDERRMELQRRMDLIEVEKERWSEISQAVWKTMDDLELELGGYVPKKQKTEMRTQLSHVEIEVRMAGWLRQRRVEKEVELLERTRKLIAASNQGGGPAPRLLENGIAWELVDRPYCTLIMQEATLRLPGLIPWRPSVFRRAKLGIHITADTLELAIVGRDGKVERDKQGRVKRSEVSIPQIVPITYPEQTRDVVEILRLVIGIAQPWLLENPSRTGMRKREEGDDEFLLLTADGVPWRIAPNFSRAFSSLLQTCARGVNANLQPGEEPISLPTSWGAAASYVLRFLWGHRAKESGLTYEEIAEVLGNSPETVKLHYQDEQQTEALNRAAGKIAHGAVPAPAPLSVPIAREASPAASPSKALATVSAESEFDALKAAKAEFDADAEALGLDADERAEYWQTRKAEIKAAWRARRPPPE